VPRWGDTGRTGAKPGFPPPSRASRRRFECGHLGRSEMRDTRHAELASSRVTAGGRRWSKRVDLVRVAPRHRRGSRGRSRAMRPPRGSRASR
jgi:hypothetical protein